AVWQDVGADARQFRRLFAFPRPYRSLLIIAWLGTAGYAAAGAGLAHMVQPIFDDVLIHNVNVLPVAVTIVLLYLVKGVCSYLSTTFVCSVGQRAVTDLRNALYKHVLNQSFTFLGRNSTGALMSHIT